MTHLTPTELIDALDASLPSARRAHLDTCDRCRNEAHALQALLGDVRQTEVPEPSPLFWEHFSARVRAAVALEMPSRPPARWFEWPVVAPLAALALLVLALVSAMPSGNDAPALQTAAVGSTAGPADSTADSIDSEWALVADLVDEFAARGDITGLPAGPGVADRAVLQLSVVEQQELMRLLREELRVGG